MKRLIIQGDDWGYKPEASRGIEYAYENGILTQTTVMANVLDPDKKNEYRKQINILENKTALKKPKLGIGVHLNLTYGNPLSPKWPQDNFTRPHKGSGKPKEWQGNAWREYFTQFTKQQVEDEYRKQIELVLDIFEEITHIDSHQMTASYEPMLQVYEKFAMEYDVPIRPVAPLSEKPIYGGDFISDDNENEKLRKKGIKIPDKNVFTLFFNETNPIKAFLNETDKAEDGKVTEIMFHPAKGEGAEDWRKTDLDTLTSPEVIEYFKNEAVSLINYSSL